MSNNTKGLEPAFQGAGAKLGTEIWRIENFQPVPIPKADYGKFYMGDSYIILQTSPGKGGAYQYDIYFWLGKDTSQDEAGTAAIKTVEMDAILGGRAVQHRELQGHESDKLLSLFKPCIVPLEGGFASGFKTPEEEEFETRLYVCKGKRLVRLKQVLFSRSSLNHDDVFVLDTKDKIFQFNGATSNIQERAKALEVVQFLKDKYHGGVCNVGLVDDGKLQAESDSGEFWVTFGGFAPIGKKVATEDDAVAEKTPATLYSIEDGQVKPVDGELSRSVLESSKCFIMDCGNEVFSWVGRVTSVEDRKTAIQATEEFVQNRPRSTIVTRVMQGYETHAFKSNFDSWPSSSSAPDESKGKVAAMLKQQGGGFSKGGAKTAPAAEEVPPLLEAGGKLEVWRVDGSAKTPIEKEDIGKFYSGDCYVILYTYHSHDKKEDFYLCTWNGKDSTEEDRTTAASLATGMFNTLKGKPVQGRIFQGKEPPQFVAIFQPLVVIKGGLSSGYKDYVADKGLKDQTYTSDTVALFRISGTLPHNNKVLQVDTVATSLNTNEIFVLQSGSSVFIWQGKASTSEQQQLALKIAEFLKPGVTVKYAKEGTETSTFWTPLGGKQNYTGQKKVKEVVRDPHLFTYSFSKSGKFEAEEVYNFCQDDLLTEDILILDTHAEVLVWVGQATDAKEKQRAFEIGQKYIDMAASLEGLSPRVPLYKVMEGYEPCFFTTYFQWDNAKAVAQGNSFQKKVMILFGGGQVAEEKGGNSGGGPRQRAEALAALNSAFSGSGGKKPTARPSGGQGQRAAAVAALSQVLTAEKIAERAHSPSTEVTTSDAGMGDKDSNGEEPKEAEPEEEQHDEEPELKGKGELADDDNCSSLTKYSYEQLRAKSENPVMSIDFQCRETYLAEEEFEGIFEMSKDEFYKLPKWKQNMLKKKHDLF